jgi:hypothetical protein
MCPRDPCREDGYAVTGGGDGPRDDHDSLRDDGATEAVHFDGVTPGRSGYREEILATDSDRCPKVIDSFLELRGKIWVSLPCLEHPMTTTGRPHPRVEIRWDRAVGSSRRSK